MAPEQIIQNEYSKKIDIWPCGILMYKLLTGGQHPFYTKAESNEAYFNRVKNIDQEPLRCKFSSTFSDLAKDFFNKLCSYPANQRYNAQTALEHPWITRDREKPIPLTQKQALISFEKEKALRKLF